MFAEGAGTFWSASNNSDLGSALSYIPETPWAQGRVVADGSGISSYYQTPSWQRGPGVPSSDPALTQGGDWVTGVTITNGGSGYTSAPTVTFTGGGCVNER
jgi:transcription elongation factor